MIFGPMEIFEGWQAVERRHIVYTYEQAIERSPDLQKDAQSIGIT